MGARMTMNRWAQYTADVKEKADAVTELYAAAIVDSAQQKAPYKHGLLKASIEQAGDGASLARRRIIVGQFYGLFMEEGTKPHVIKNAWGKHSVNHPGTDPRPFLVPAANQYRADYKAAIRGVL